MKKENREKFRLKYFNEQLKLNIRMLFVSIGATALPIYTLTNMNSQIERANQYYGGDFKPPLISLVILGVSFIMFYIWQIVESKKRLGSIEKELSVGQMQ